MAAVWACALAAVPAQQEPTSEPRVSISIDGLARMRERFADTNLGRALDAARDEEWFLRLQSLLARQFELSGAKLPDDEVWRELSGAFEEYRGTATLTYRSSGEGGEHGLGTEFTLVFHMPPDGHSDLGAVRERVDLALLELLAAREAGSNDVKPRTVQPAGGTGNLFEVRTTDDGIPVQNLIASTADGHLLLAQGTELGERVTAVVQRAVAEDAVADSAPVSVRLGSRILANAFGAASTRGSGSDRNRPDLSGLSNELRELTVAVEPHGSHVVVRSVASFDSPNAALPSFLGSLENDRGSIVDLIPRETETFDAIALDLPRILDWALADDAAPHDAEELFGFDPREEFVARLDGRIVVLTDTNLLLEAADSMMALTMLGGGVILGLQDAQGLERFVDATIAGTPLAPGRGTREHRGVTIHTLVVAGAIPVEWAFLDDYVVAAFGRPARRTVNAVIERASMSAEERARDPWPEAIASRLSVGTEPTAFVGAIRHTTYAELLLAALRIAERTQQDVEPWLLEMRPLLEPLVALQHEHELDTAVTVVRREGATLILERVQ